MISGTAIIVAAVMVYGVAVKPRQTSTQPQPQPSAEAAIPPTSQPVTSSPQQTQPPVEAAIPPTSQPVTSSPQQMQPPLLTPADLRFSVETENDVVVVRGPPSLR